MNYKHIAWLMALLVLFLSLLAGLAHASNTKTFCKDWYKGLERYQCTNPLPYPATKDLIECCWKKYKIKR